MTFDEALGKFAGYVVHRIQNKRELHIPSTMKGLSQAAREETAEVLRYQAGQLENAAPISRELLSRRTRKAKTLKALADLFDSFND